MDIPMSLRVVAGLVVTGVDQLRRLPGDLPQLAVSVAGTAARLSLRVQQELAELAIRGEEALGPLLHQPEEHPAWAHFDDEDQPAPDCGETGADAGAGDTGPGGGADAGADAGAEAGGAGGSEGPGADGAGVSAAADAPGGAGPRESAAESADSQTWTIAQLRGHLRSMSSDQVADLLAAEVAGPARPAFLTMLQNRLTTLAAS